MYDGGWMRRDPNFQGVTFIIVMLVAAAGSVLLFDVLPEGGVWDACCLSTLALSIVFILALNYTYTNVQAWQKDFKPSSSDVRRLVEEGLKARAISYEERKPDGPEGFSAPQCVWAIVLRSTKVYVKVSDLGTRTRVYVGPDDAHASPLVEGIRRIVDESMGTRRLENNSFVVRAE